MKSFHYLEPRSIDEAARLLQEHGAGARILAGGTDLIVQMETGRRQPATVVYLGRILELRGIDAADGGGLRIGAAATLRQVENHPVVRERYPSLSRGCAEVGSVQIRNLATLAGNLCNASPSADTSPALLAYDAQVEITGAGAGTRVVAVGDFWTGPGRTVLEPGQLVTAIHLPAAPAGRRDFYTKLAVRKAMDLAMVGICVALVPDGDAARDVRIALGAVAPVCLRAAEAEAAVERGGASAIEEAAALAAAAVSPIGDQRASAEYRREMVRVLTARALHQLLS